MLTRILALVAVLLLAPSTLAHANARALSLESASLGIFARNVDLLKEIPDLTHCCIKEKSTERSESSNRREEYLRARYMDPGQGRFVGMDTHPGTPGDPSSLHRYLYAYVDPISRTDPSGLLASLTEAEIAQMLQQNMGRTVVVQTSVSPIKKALVATALIVVGAVAMVINEVTEPKGIPILIVGKNHPESRTHIREAQAGNSPSILHRSSPHSRDWIYRDLRCKDKTGANTGKDCDEYPFSKTHEGGEENRYRVSLKPVTAADNQGAGGVYGAMVLACRIPRYNENTLLSTFKVVTSDVLNSTFTCARR